MYKKILSLIITFGIGGGLFAATGSVSERSHLNLKSFDVNHSTLEASSPDFSIGRISFAQGVYDFLDTDLDGQFRIIGAPDLPTTSTLLAVPATGDLQADFSYASFRVESNVNLAPFQPVQLEAEGIDKRTIVRMVNDNPKKILKSREETKDYVLIAPNEEYLINSEWIKSKCGWSLHTLEKWRGKIIGIIRDKN